MEVFDGIRAGVLADRSQFFKDLTKPLLRRQQAERQGLQGLRIRSGFRGCKPVSKGSLIASRPYSETDFTKDPRKWTCRPDPPWRRRPDRGYRRVGPALAKLIKGATLKIYPGAPHGHVLDPQGPGQRGFARVHQGIDDHATCTNGCHRHPQEAK